MASSYPPSQSTQYARQTILRAERAARCAPFRAKLYTTMRVQGVALSSIAGTRGVQNGYTRHPLPELMADDELAWLMQIGLLRREVDGQGLTDSFRLTPLGRQLMEKWEQQGGIGYIGHATWRDRLLNFLTRWLRLPSWLL